MRARSIAAVLFVTICGIAAAEDNMAQQIEKAHGADNWYNHEMVRADMRVEFGGNVRIDGIATFDPYLSMSHIDNKDGTTIVFDGTEAYVSPASAEMKGARFNALTWPYFLAAPMKIGDPGAHLEPMESMAMDGKEMTCAKMTFDPGTGDAPDDWYVLYTDPTTHELRAMAYVVTYFSGKAGEPHAIKYEDYKDFDGARLSTKWTFYNWSKEEGMHGDPIGNVTIRNVTFAPMDKSLFEKPADSRVDKHPMKP